MKCSSQSTNRVPFLVPDCFALSLMPCALANGAVPARDFQRNSGHAVEFHSGDDLRVGRAPPLHERALGQERPGLHCAALSRPGNATISILSTRSFIHSFIHSFIYVFIYLNLFFNQL